MSMKLKNDYVVDILRESSSVATPIMTQDGWYPTTATGTLFACPSRLTTGSQQSANAWANLKTNGQVSGYMLGDLYSLNGPFDGTFNGGSFEVWDPTRQEYVMCTMYVDEEYTEVVSRLADLYWTDSNGNVVSPTLHMPDYANGTANYHPLTGRLFGLGIVWNDISGRYDGILGMCVNAKRSESSSAATSYYTYYDNGWNHDSVMAHGYLLPRFQTGTVLTNAPMCQVKIETPTEYKQSIARYKYEISKQTDIII